MPLGNFGKVRLWLSLSLLILVTFVLADPELMLGLNGTKESTILVLNDTTEVVTNATDPLDNTMDETQPADDNGGGEIDEIDESELLGDEAGLPEFDIEGGVIEDYSDCDYNLSSCKSSGWVANSVYCFNQSSWEAAGTCFQIDADNVTFDCKGNTLTGDGTGFGIYADGRDNVTVKNCVLNEFAYAILLNDTSNSLLQNNSMNDNINAGIQLQYCSGVDITSNLANSTDEGNGITLLSSSGNMVYDNTCGQNYYVGIGLYLGSDGNTVDFNQVTYNGYPGIFLNASDNNNITSNTASRNGEVDEDYNNGIYLVDSTDNLIYNNTAEDNTWAGLELYYGSDGNNVTGNTFESNDECGIYVEESSGNSITENDANDNSLAGIELYNASSNTLSDNNLTGNVLGLLLYLAPDNTVSGNNLTNNDYYSLFDDGGYGCNLVGDDNIGGDGELILYVNDTDYAGASLLSDNDTYSEVVLCHVNNSVIENVTVSNPNTGSDGVLLVYSNNNTINQGTFDSDLAGVALYNSMGNTIDNNNVSNFTMVGIAVFNFEGLEGYVFPTYYFISSGEEIADETEGPVGIAQAMMSAFEALADAKTEIEDSDLSDPGDFAAQTAIWGYSAGAVNGNNVVSDNTADGNELAGIFLWSSNNTVVNNTITSDELNLGGVILYFSDNNTLANNTLQENLAGLYLINDTGSNMTNNTAEVNFVGLFMLYSSDTTVEANTLCFNLFDIAYLDSDPGWDNRCDYSLDLDVGEALEDADYGMCEDVCSGITLEKTSDITEANHGDTINWTINITNIGVCNLTINLTDSNGHSFDTIENLTPGESWNESYTTTAGYCDIINEVTAEALNIYDMEYNFTDSTSVTIDHCGDGRCNCGETCRSCRGDCGSCGGGGSGGRIANYVASPITLPSPPQKPVPQMEVSLDAPEINTDITVTVTYPDGTPVSGEVVATAPDGTTRRLMLINGIASLQGSEPGLWKFSYTYEGGTLEETVDVSEVVTPPVPIVNDSAGQMTGQTGAAIVTPKKAPAEDMDWIWIVAAVIIIAALLLIIKNRRAG